MSNYLGAEAKIQAEIEVIKEAVRNVMNGIELSGKRSGSRHKIPLLECVRAIKGSYRIPIIIDQVIYAEAERRVENGLV